MTWTPKKNVTLLGSIPIAWNVLSFSSTFWRLQFHGCTPVLQPGFRIFGICTNLKKLLLDFIGVQDGNGFGHDSDESFISTYEQQSDTPHVSALRNLLPQPVVDRLPPAKSNQLFGRTCEKHCAERPTGPPGETLESRSSTGDHPKSLVTFNNSNQFLLPQKVPTKPILDYFFRPDLQVFTNKSRYNLHVLSSAMAAAKPTINAHIPKTEIITKSLEQ